MKTSTAKAKGRRLQQWMRDLLIEELEVDPEDIESRPMGSQGEDLIMALGAREKFPFSIECNNHVCLIVWRAWEQANENCGKYQPLLVIKKNNVKTLVVLDAEVFMEYVKEFNNELVD